MEDGSEVFNGSDVVVTVPPSAVVWKHAPSSEEHGRQPLCTLKWGSYSASMGEDGSEVFEDAHVRVCVPPSAVRWKLSAEERDAKKNKAAESYVEYLLRAAVLMRDAATAIEALASAKACPEKDVGSL